MPKKKASIVARAGDRVAQLVTFAGIGAKILCEFIRHVHKVVGIRRCGLLPRDVGPDLRIFGINLKPLFEAGLGIRLDRVDRAFRLANAAIDAFVGVDDEHVLTLIEAVHRAHLDTIRVFAANAALVDDVGHLSLLTEGCYPGTNPLSLEPPVRV
jgi:hypothetical protein